MSPLREQRLSTSSRGVIAGHPLTTGEITQLPKPENSDNSPKGYSAVIRLGLNDLPPYWGRKSTCAVYEELLYRANRDVTYRMVDHPAGFFEGTEMPTAGWWEALWSAPRNVLMAVGISPEMEVVDLYSGDGWFTLEIARLARSVVAIDIDPQLLEVARIRLIENRVTNGSFLVGDAYDVQKLFGHQTDFVFMANSFHGVPDKPHLARAVTLPSNEAVSLRLSIGISDHARIPQY
jgi:SAM-dependent methyltransferase